MNRLLQPQQRPPHHLALLHRRHRQRAARRGVGLGAEMERMIRPQLPHHRALRPRH
jgi:hypothetical protein